MQWRWVVLLINADQRYEGVRFNVINTEVLLVSNFQVKKS